MENEKLKEQVKRLMGRNSIKWLTLEVFPTRLFLRKYDLLRKMLSPRGNLDLYPNAKEVLIEWCEEQEAKK